MTKSLMLPPAQPTSPNPAYQLLGYHEETLLELTVQGFSDKLSSAIIALAGLVISLDITYINLKLFRGLPFWRVPSAVSRRAIDLMTPLSGTFMTAMVAAFAPPEPILYTALADFDAIVVFSLMSMVLWRRRMGREIKLGEDEVCRAEAMARDIEATDGGAAAAEKRAEVAGLRWQVGIMGMMRWSLVTLVCCAACLRLCRYWGLHLALSGVFPGTYVEMRHD